MQRDVPGIDHSFLAMDTEEGVEVVWNEVQFSERKYFKSQEVMNCCHLIHFQCFKKGIYKNLKQGNKTTETMETTETTKIKQRKNVKSLK